MNDCWLYAQALTVSGYGCIYVYDPSTKKSHRLPAHRVMYEALVGEIPAGLVIDHLCRVRSCINPAHMEPVTNVENVRRGLRGRVENRKTHCAQGHEFTPENTYLKTGGTRQRRVCKTCSNASHRKLYRKNYFPGSTIENNNKKLARIAGRQLVTRLLIQL